MQSFLDFVTTKEVLMVLGGVGILILLYIITVIYQALKRREMRKNLHNNTLELNKLVEEVAQKQAEEKEEPLPEVFQKNFQEITAEEPKAVEMPKVVEMPKEVEPVVSQPQEEVIEKGFATPLEVEPKIKEEPVIEPVTPKETPSVLATMYDSPVEILEVEETPQEAPVMLKEEPLQYKDEVYTKEEAKEELERITEELRLQEIEEQKEKLTDFEEKQEENAIISLQELLEKGKTLTAMNEETQYKDEGNEPISIQELEERYQKEQQEKIEKQVEEKPVPKVEEAPVEILEEVSKETKTVPLQDFHTVRVEPYKGTNSYKPTPVISPIFGIEEDHIAKENALALENTANYEKLDDEIRKTNEFLSQLKELQKKLD